VLPEVQELQDYLSRVSPARLKAVKWPVVSWCARGRCFALFEQGMTPRGISPKRARVKRTTLYRYYEDYKILSAQRELRRCTAEMRQQSAPAAVVPKSRSREEWDLEMAAIGEKQRLLDLREEHEGQADEAEVEADEKISPTSPDAWVRHYFGNRGVSAR